MRKFNACLGAAAVALASGGGTSALAAPITIDLPETTVPFTYPVSSTDLLESAAVTSSGNFVHEGSSGPAALTDGVFQINGGNPADNSPLTTPEAGAQVTFTLDTSVNTFGYDLANVVTYGGWNDTGRDRQTFTIEYATVGALGTFVPLDSIDHNPADPDGGISAVLAIFPTTLTNVGALRFTFGPQENGYAGYGEFDASGTPSAVPEPATLSLLGLGGLALLARRRRA